MERGPLPRPQAVSNMVLYLAAPLGGTVNGRATDRLDRSYHHWWNCRLARRAVHEEPNGAVPSSLREYSRTLPKAGEGDLAVNAGCSLLGCISGIVFGSVLVI